MAYVQGLKVNIVIVADDVALASDDSTAGMLSLFCRLIRSHVNLKIRQARHCRDSARAQDCWRRGRGGQISRRGAASVGKMLSSPR